MSATLARGLAALLLLTSSAAAQPMRSGDRIVGEWRGASVCVDRSPGSACKDERIRYVFAPATGGGNVYHVRADKLVDGAYQSMGDIDVTYDAARATWTYAFSSPRCPGCTWWYRIEGDGLVGGITSRAGAQLRHVTAVRHGR